MSSKRAKESYMTVVHAMTRGGAIFAGIVIFCACETPKNSDIAAPTPTPKFTVAVPPSGSETAVSEAQRAGVEPTYREVAVLAGGCFWGMEEILRGIPGVLETEVGYSGGELKSPRYEDVKSGQSGHAESVRIVFDPSLLSYSDLLEKWFFRMHDPTTKNRQGNDVGTQYRSAIFYGSEAQRDTAREVIRKVNDSKQWDQPIVTELVPVGEFTAAEDYHQDYLEKNPGGYTCHFMRESAL